MRESVRYGDIDYLFPRCNSQIQCGFVCVADVTIRGQRISPSACGDQFFFPAMCSKDGGAILLWVRVMEVDRGIHFALVTF